jgi:hypothetical protein
MSGEWRAAEQGCSPLSSPLARIGPGWCSQIGGHQGRKLFLPVPICYSLSAVAFGSENLDVSGRRPYTSASPERELDEFWTPAPPLGRTTGAGMKEDLDDVAAL